MAQRSSEAAGEIGGLIHTSGDQIENGARMVTEAGAALQQILTAVAEISGQVRDIAASTAEQSSGLGEINTAISQLDQTTQRNAAMVEETTAAARLLTSESVAMAQATARFRLADGAEPAPPTALSA